MQYTLAKAMVCEGISLHQGKHVTMTINPAPEGHGICFRRTDIENMPAAIIRADYRYVVDTRLCTVLENEHGVRLSTVEHLMAALWGCGIDNALIDIDGAEVPVMDGSAEPFIFLIECAGIVAQDAPRRYIKLDVPVIVQEGESCAIACPWDQNGFALDVDIHFKHQAIGRQSYHFNSVEMSFQQMLSRARTFGFYEEVEALQAAGLARGGSMHNAVVINHEGIMNQDGLRYEDECVRHKALDCIGDYFLAGHRLLGHIKTSRPGHSLNSKLIKAILSRSDAWHYVDAPDDLLPAHIVSAIQGQGLLAAGI